MWIYRGVLCVGGGGGGGGRGCADTCVGGPPLVAFCSASFLQLVVFGSFEKLAGLFSSRSPQSSPVLGATREGRGDVAAARASSSSAAAASIVQRAESCEALSLVLRSFARHPLVSSRTGSRGLSREGFVVV